MENEFLMILKVKRIKQQLRRAEADKQRAEAKLAAKRQTIR